jgi:flagellar M-ring protein FliF
MPEALTELKQQVVEFWKNLDNSQKKRLYITSAIIATAVTIAIVFLTKPAYVTLISNADAKQVGEMSNILNDNNIWNSIEDNGTSILINSKENNKAQVALAQQGYPKGGLTFEDAINMIGISTTESDKKHIWKQQRMSDLEAKIEMLDNIEEATASLAIPERTVFLTGDEQKERPTAYVMVKPNEPLTQKQVEGIVMIVSRSVENLDPKDVTIVDNNSNILNRDFEDDTILRVSSQEEMQQKKAAELEKRVYSYFSVGEFDNFDTIRVVANPVLDFNTHRSQKVEYSNPDGMDEGVVISSGILEESLTNGTPNGVPGMETNPGEGGAPTYQLEGDANSSYEKKDETKNFGVNKTESEEVKATGIMVSEASTMAISLWYGRKVTDETKLSEDFLSQVKLAASTATGIPEQNISVFKLKLAPLEIEQPTLSEKISELISEYGVFAILLILILGLMFAIIPRKKKDLQPAVEQLATAGGPSIVFPDVHEQEVPEITLEEHSEIKKQIDKFVKQKPDAVAQLLRNWLSDEWNE